MKFYDDFTGNGFKYVLDKHLSLENAKSLFKNVKAVEKGYYDPKELNDTYYDDHIQSWNFYDKKDKGLFKVSRIICEVNKKC